MVRIGITTAFDENGDESVPQPYIDALEAAGAQAVPIPANITAEDAAALVKTLDGLVYPGGPGITEGLIGALPDDLRPVEAARDSRDRTIYRAFNLQTRPILGICYGMQFINAMQGGTIYGDVSAQRDDTHNHSKGRGADEHPINILPDTHLRTIMGVDEASVNTYHIQAVADVGAGLRVNATAPDGIIEGIESLDGRILGVQFHPERMGAAMKPLFEAFVQRCKASAKAG